VCLVNAQTRIPLAQVFGGGEVASADGLRFVVPVRTLSERVHASFQGPGSGYRPPPNFPRPPTGIAGTAPAG
jgi:TnpA family transposase